MVSREKVDMNHERDKPGSGPFVVQRHAGRENWHESDAAPRAKGRVDAEGSSAADASFRFQGWQRRRRSTRVPPGRAIEGPSIDPSESRLAIEVAGSARDYVDVDDVILGGECGAGTG